MPEAEGLRYLEAIPPASPNEASSARGTLVLIHAFPLSARMWEPQRVLAACGWRLLLPQLRGFDGDSGGPPATSMDDYADDVVRLLDALEIDGAVVGGLSMGGYVAFSLLRRAPARVRGLILADTRAQADTPEGTRGRHRMLALVRENGVGAVADEMIPRLIGESTRRGRPDVSAEVRALIQANSVDAIEGAIAALMGREDSTPLLKTIRQPTLILVGAEDILTPPEASLEMHEAIAGSELVVIPAAGHLSSLEQPEAFNTAVAQFLSHRV